MTDNLTANYEVFRLKDGRPVMHDEAAAAFAKVQNPEHWKYSIDAVVEPDDLELACRAIAFFTGSVATWEPCQVAKRHRDGLVSFLFPAFHVRAVGYYAAVGA